MPVRSREAKEGGSEEAPRENPERWRLPAEAPARASHAGGLAQAGSRTGLSAEVLTKADDNFPPSPFGLWRTSKFF
ncbi:MAG: hypothetical protein AAB340_02285, partial [Patescibacteria group bacterium]